VISVICVYNDQEMLERRLLASLRSQVAEHEVLMLDNRRSAFQSAAPALNRAARGARGQWLMFAHQDVCLLSERWLAEGEKLVTACEDLGWAGVYGMAADGIGRGLLRDRAALRGAPFQAPTEVQTLDECILICRREKDDYSYFDEGVPGWHAYGVEACCSAMRGGRHNFAIPAPIWHDSRSTNVIGLGDAQSYVWSKHGAALPHIYTTCGFLPESLSAGDRIGARLWTRGVRLVQRMAHRGRGFRGGYHVWFHDSLEALTEDEAEVDCLHSEAAFSPIEAEAFVPQPKRPRRIVHRFVGADAGMVGTRTVVIAPDLAAELADIAVLKWSQVGVRRVVVCLDVKDARRRASLWRSLCRESTDRILSKQLDGTRTAIFDVWV
jgi:hypothetical protein